MFTKRMEVKFVNTQELDVLNVLHSEPYSNQRALSEACGHSLGIVNKALKGLLSQGYIDDQMQLTAKAVHAFAGRKPRNAVILAAGFGMRMVPINMSTPKALIEVAGERLIDRLISQLHAVGITDITVIVGFMKDSFEYLIDQYGVRLVYNKNYASRNNLASLALAADQIASTYIVPCDLWCGRNPFNAHELYSWYMVSDLMDAGSDVRVNRKMELVKVKEKAGGNSMVGIAFLTGKEAETVKEKLIAFNANPDYNNRFWEETLYSGSRMIVQPRMVHAADVAEINTYEQLRDLDSASNQLRSEALKTISEQLHCRTTDIVNITILKKGMTNRSFLFTVHGVKYIMRIPGEGTDQLINRKQETDVYRAISGHGLCDEPVYINPENGYKMTRYLEGVRVCDRDSVSDLTRCMTKLRQFHEMKLQVAHTFDLFGQIDFYESLWEGAPSVYGDYHRTKENVRSLKPFVDGLMKDWCLTHIDAVPDNFLFCTLPDGTEALQLTDWEYAGMQDPHVDIAMFCVYSLYSRSQCDRLIDIYFEGKCDSVTKAKIYCYISICGLLWSNWCEFKRRLGVEFGEYSLRQYRFAKDFCRYAKDLIEKGGTDA